MDPDTAEALAANPITMAQRINLSDDGASFVVLDTLPDDLKKHGADAFDTLFNLHPEERGKVQMQNGEVESPRWYKSYLNTPTFNPSLHYSYMFSGQDDTGIRDPLQVVINWYKDGQDYTAQHSDCEEGMEEGADIVVISLGDERLFKIRPKHSPHAEDLRIRCSHGSVLTWGLGRTAGRASVGPAEGRTGLNRSVGGRRSSLGLVITTIDSHVRDNGLVNSLGRRASARSLSGNGGTREDGLAAGCNGLVGCSEQGTNEVMVDVTSTGMVGGGRRVDRASSNSTGLGVHRASGSIEVRRINGERCSVRSGCGEGVVSKTGCVLRGASSHVGLVRGTASIVGGVAVSGRTLLELELARKCRSSSQKCNSGEGGSEVHVD
ncbi:hypothetical protein KCU61_g337, partial [Aureobasidium melanogenum]